MTEVTDANGVKWSVNRWWFKAIPWETGIDFLDFIFFIIVLPFMILWPFWFLLKWLGVRWAIVIERDGKKGRAGAGARLGQVRPARRGARPCGAGRSAVTALSRARAVVAAACRYPTMSGQAVKVSSNNCSAPTEAARARHGS